MRAFRPGPLTIVFRARRALHPFLLGPGGKVAIRVPGNRFCLKLIRECGLPLVSTSANRSGAPIPADHRKLLALFAERADLLIDGGELHRALPSTVVDLTTDLPVILREGAVRRAALERVFREYA
jgi:L-threonylcarbamoyladenylate synthase